MLLETTALVLLAALLHAAWNALVKTAASPLLTLASLNLLTTAFFAPLAKASLTKLCPSFLFPLIAKNKDLEVICFEFMETFLKLK